MPEATHVQPNIGTIVRYKLSIKDVSKIKFERERGIQRRGELVKEGEVCTMFVTAHRPDGSINGHVILDGNDAFWAIGVFQGDATGQWQFVPADAPAVVPAGTAGKAEIAKPGKKQAGAADPIDPGRAQAA